MSIKNHKNNIPNSYFIWTPFFIFIFLFCISKVSAFSLNGLFGFLPSATATQQDLSGREENLQTLKVFENKKDSPNVQQGVVVPAEITDLNSTTFEVDGNVLTDDLSNDSNVDNHSDNAVYTVQKGDSINSIAAYFSVTVDTITSYNHMTSRTVHVGDVLEVPSEPGFLYTIKKGDTLQKISDKYSVNADDVSLYNGLISGDDLAVGDELWLVGAKVPDNIKNSTKTKNKITYTSNLAGDATGKIRILNGRVAGQWSNGDTEHLNTSSAIAKYSSLPKYPGYYLLPSPGATRTQKMHGNNGVDLANKLGSPVLAAADGVIKVARTGGYNYGYGNYIIVSHSNGTETLYGHLQRVEVNVGQSVAKGEEIAKLGSTGNSTGPHVHFEVHGAYNPFAW